MIMTGSDIAIILIVAALVSGALWKIVRDKKKGVPCSGCSSCPASGSCHIKDTEKSE